MCLWKAPQIRTLQTEVEKLPTLIRHTASVAIANFIMTTWATAIRTLPGEAANLVKIEIGFLLSPNQPTEPRNTWLGGLSVSVRYLTRIVCVQTLS